MKFQSKWITTLQFADLEPINVFRKEKARDKTEPGPVKNDHVHFRKKVDLPKAKDVHINIYPRMIITSCMSMAALCARDLPPAMWTAIGITGRIRPAWDKILLGKRY